MKLRVSLTVDCDDGSYEAEFADDEGRLSEDDVPRAVLVAARVLEHVLDGRATRVDAESPWVATPKRGPAN